MANKCLDFGEVKLNFSDATFYCSTYGNKVSQLSINNAFENNEVSQALQSMGYKCDQYYLDLKRNGSNWVWLNGESTSYRNWKNGYPTNDNTQNCVSFDTQTGSWYNTGCDTQQCFICQLYA
uniref:C-type lectin domain-containing protein n=1 Tax=Acrobeloides nanus TaxID=290746 RepID=A0A914CU95_9BILA